MLNPSDAELLALATCPPTQALSSSIPPIDVVDVRMDIQRTALKDLLDHLAACLCDNMVVIGGELKKINGHLKRLVGKELKGTGVALAQIAEYLKAISANQTAEIGIALSQLIGGLSVPPVNYTPEILPVPPRESIVIEADLDEYKQPIPQPQPPTQTPPEPEALPPAEEIPLPEEEAIFEPETSAPVGGGTIAVPLSLRTPAGPLPDELIVEISEDV